MALKVIAIDNFEGGRDTTRPQAMIDNNQCASGSMNVWAPFGTLTKFPGVNNYMSSVSGGNINYGNMYPDTTLNKNFTMYYMASYPVGYFPWANSFAGDTLTPLGYTNGTVSVSGAGLVSATGLGTLWSANVTAGDYITFNTTSSAYYQVGSVEDDTHITIAAVSTSVAVGSSYKILPHMSFYDTPMASLNGNLVFCTTADTMAYYDGTQTFRLSSGPKAAYLAVFKDYLFSLRQGSFKSRLQWSAIRDPLTWPANNFVDIDKDHGYGTGLFAFGNELIVFKTQGLLKVIGDIFDPSNPTYSVVRIATPAGFACRPGFTPCVWKGRLIFMAWNKIYQYLPGTSYITEISQSIQRDLPDNLPDLYSSQGQTKTGARAISIQDTMFLKGVYSPNSATPETPGGFFILDQRGKWWFGTDKNQSAASSPWADGAAGVATQTQNRPLVVFGGSAFLTSSGRLYYFDPTQTDRDSGLFTNTIEDTLSTATSLAINGVWVSKEFNIDYGTFKWVVIYLKKQSAGNLTVQWSIDQGSSVTSTVDMTTGRGQIIRAVLPVNQKGSTIQLTLSNNTVSQNFNIYGMKIYYEESDLERLL